MTSKAKSVLKSYRCTTSRLEKLGFHSPPPPQDMSSRAKEGPPDIYHRTKGSPGKGTLRSTARWRRLGRDGSYPLPKGVPNLHRISRWIVVFEGLKCLSHRECSYRSGTGGRNVLRNIVAISQKGKQSDGLGLVWHVSLVHSESVVHRCYVRCARWRA